MPNAAKAPPRPRRNSRQSLAAAEVVRRLRFTYAEADCELRWSNPLELLIATILSAQCTDVRVNLVTPALFAKYPRPEDYLAVTDEELQGDIRSTGFFRNKTKSIKGACRRLLEAFDGQVPRTMEEMLSLPGVARKTANVVLGTAYGHASGVVVDTHVRRLAFRLGWTRQQDPEKIEDDLMRLLPSADWIFAAHALIWHGRRICVARKPRCPVCPLLDVCPRKGVTAVGTAPAGNETASDEDILVGEDAA